MTETTKPVGAAALNAPKVDTTAPVADSRTLANFLNDNVGSGFRTFTGKVEVSSGGVITLVLQASGDAGRSITLNVTGNDLKVSE